MAGDFLHLDEKTRSQWPKSNTSDPQSRRWFLAYSIVLTIFASATVLTRVYLHTMKGTNKFRIDDVLTVIAWVFGLFLTTVCIVGTQHYGFDRHIWDMPPAMYNTAALIQWLSEGAFILSMCSIKVSVLCFFKRLDPACSTELKRIIYIFIIFTTCNALADMLTLVLQCQSIRGSWTISSLDRPSDRTCISKHVYYPVHGLITCFTTAYTILIPVLVLHQFPMTKYQRTGLNWIAIASLSVLGAGIARTFFLYRFVTSANGDATWNGFNVFVCAQAECDLALISASVPFLHSLFQRNHTLPIVFDPDTASNQRSNSLVSRLSSPVRSTIKRLHVYKCPKTSGEASLPQAREIPEWEFEALRTPGGTIRHSIETTYERYRQGDFGPPVPPKDLGEWLETYRHDHRQMAQGYPF